MNKYNGSIAWFCAGMTIFLAAPNAVAETISVTGVRLNETEQGVEIVLETSPLGEVRTFQTEFGNTIAIDILNTRLQSDSSEGFRRQNPTANIAAIEVIQQNQNSIRILVSGTQQVPNVQLTEQQERLTLAVDSGTPVAQEGRESEPQPETPTQPEELPTQPETQPEPGEPIRLIVTPTRTEEREEDVARSTTVITREEIEEQTGLSTNLPDLLGRTVPGLGPPTQSASTRTQSLRGRQPFISVDGVPLNSNRRDFQGLRGIDPSAIERIEVVRGPTAVFGSDATGGVINIITREAARERITGSTSISLGPRLSLSDLSESFGGGISQSLSGDLGSVDYAFTASFEGTGNAFDAGNDLIPIGRSQGLDNLETLNLFGKVGVDITEDQRLQVSANYFDDKQDVPTLSDSSVNETPQRETARALDTGDLDIDELPGREETVINLNYSHDDLLGSQFSLQGFFQESLTRTIPEDNRDTIFQSVSRTEIDSEKLGIRLEVETPIFENANLFWGADYVEESVDNPIEIFNAATFDESGGTDFNKVDEEFFAPSYDLNTLGLFGQLQWDATQKLSLSGGVRFERFEVFADSYNVLGDIALTRAGNAVENVEGGDVAFDDVVFNVGAVYDLTEELSLFANFAQGFSAPDFGRALRIPPRGAGSVSEFVDVTEPVVVDNYELGVRGSWDQVQFSLAGFFTYSDLGENVRQSDEGPFLELERSPTRTYGLEASLDYQPSQDWQVGTSVTWVEGDSNPEGNDEGFVALSTREIQPWKITAYVDNQTLPSWRNRLQLLAVGGRDRAFDDGVDDRDIDGYITLDYISEVDVGPGTLQLGIQNLLDNQYFPVDSQLQSENSRNSAALGRTLSLEYSVQW